MSKDLVLITGVSGHVGFRVLIEALSRNYRVRAVVRKAEQGDRIREVKSVKPFLADLEIIVIPDLLKEGAFDCALEGVVGIVHVASPLAIATTEFKRDIIDPAIDSTTGILKSAAKTPSVRRVVFTSSIAPLLSVEYIMSDDLSKVFTAQDTYPPPDLETAQFAFPLQAYAAAKSHALAISEQFVADNKPQFEVVNIMPSMIIGRNELNTTKEEVVAGTNAVVLGPLLGHQAEMPLIGVSVHVNDVARAHIDALSPKVPGNKRLLLSSGGLKGTNWEDAKEITQRLYSKQVSEGLFPLNGNTPTRPIQLDASETDEVLGWKLQSFEEQVKSVIDHYVELASVSAVIFS
ncbi:hypothetical protein C7974DRAFT_471887 [Boeremia exigua]|uniref:uncharacterized protein n=1 Tax=Boeremia exigua TaxID=749465 RepID=UPI001E8EEDC0|nr:uncharacterized protein C7974DRAFT_471887 [Boeremia exigua]KAH6628995.1 hypothetical protein C7974DRAFT_471887 [Boeremia exigua]